MQFCGFVIYLIDTVLAIKLDSNQCLWRVKLLNGRKSTCTNFKDFWQVILCILASHSIINNFRNVKLPHFAVPWRRQFH